MRIAAVAAGANPDAANDHRVSPRALAATIGNTDVAKFFRDQRADHLTMLVAALVDQVFDDESTDEGRMDELVEAIDRISPDPEWSDYIFQTDAYMGSDGKTDVEAVVAKIMQYRPILL